MLYTMDYQKPFLKWVGGKSQIIEKILNKFPKTINNYHEPFLGGGSILFGLLTLIKESKITLTGKIFACDMNQYLINTYNDIKSNPNDLYILINHHRTIYDSIKKDDLNRNPQTYEEAISSKESYFYWIRKKFNENMKQNIFSLEQSAFFIFLNKTCFRGLYREGPNGFNVPYGHYKKTPNMISIHEIMNIHNLIKNVEFSVSDFHNSVKHITHGDFVYFDPPYAPETKTSFVNYTKDKFSMDNHIQLFNDILQLSNDNIKFILSNSRVELVTNYFSNYNLEIVKAKRAINSKHPDSTCEEVIIYN